MYRVITAPTERFSRLKEKPDWLLPMILALLLPLVLSALAMVAFPRKVMISAAEERTQRVRDFVETRLSRAPNLSEEQKAQAVQQMDERTRAELDLLRNSSPPAFFGQTLLRSLPAVVWSAGLLLLWSVVLNFALPMFGVGGSFRRTLAVTANAALVRPLGSFCRGAVMLATGNLMVRTNLLLVLPSDAPALLRAFGSYVDVFTLWEVALVAVGLRVAFGVDTRKTAAVAFGAWLVYALLLAAVSSVLGIAELF